MSCLLAGFCAVIHAWGLPASVRLVPVPAPACSFSLPAFDGTQLPFDATRIAGSCRGLYGRCGQDMSLLVIQYSIRGCPYFLFSLGYTESLLPRFKQWDRQQQAFSNGTSVLVPPQPEMPKTCLLNCVAICGTDSDPAGEKRTWTRELKMEVAWSCWPLLVNASFDFQFAVVCGKISVLMLLCPTPTIALIVMRKICRPVWCYDLVELMWSWPCLHRSQQHDKMTPLSFLIR